MRSLAVQLNDERVGTLYEGDGLWRFQYEAAWQRSPQGFDLSPALRRSMTLHQDGGSMRPVQWYFDNLLPEEALREAVSREAGISGEDSFALLEYLGAESAGSLILINPQATQQLPGGLRPLPDDELSRRIQNMLRVPLSSTAPKRMSAAGAQNKLLVVYRDGALYEPTGNEASTHILKPDNASADYPATVINEYLVMRLAQALGMPVPQVERRYVPEPVYIIERFDRYQDETNRTRRSHIIDACQLLNKSRISKYAAATLDALAEIIQQCTNKARTRIALFQWLLYNLLVGNNDNHLKNLSFKVDREGIALSPLYDLVSTMIYHTPIAAHERADWPLVPLTLPLPGCSTYEKVTRADLIKAGAKLGLPPRTCEREIIRMSRALLATLDGLIQNIQAENLDYPEGVRRFLAGEVRLIQAIRHIVVREMLGRILDT
jgi:serine/threonine-protein kinase HipA